MLTLGVLRARAVKQPLVDFARDTFFARSPCSSILTTVVRKKFIRVKSWLIFCQSGDWIVGKLSELWTPYPFASWSGRPSASLAERFSASHRCRTTRAARAALARTARRREPVPAKAVGVVPGTAGEAAACEQCEPNDADRVVAAGGLASGPGGRQTGYVHSVAPTAIPTVLALEIGAVGPPSCPCG